MKKNNEIVIKGARLNNLKNISLKIPKNKIIVVTGVSGSGKSTLAYDTIFAEAQRRYIESLSSYARQFLKNHQKPEFDSINGLSPAIALENKTTNNNPRSTVGTSTEIYHYLCLLFEQLGVVISPVSKNVIEPLSFISFQNYIMNLKSNTKFIVASPIEYNRINYFHKRGYSKIIYNNKIINISDFKEKSEKVFIVINRLVVKDNKDFVYVLKETYDNGLDIGKGFLSIFDSDCKMINSFNDHMIENDLVFEKPSQSLFNFNNPYGACVKCKGHGDVIDIDENKVIPDKNLSISNNAIHPWISSGMQRRKNEFIENLKNINFPIHKKYCELTQEQKNIIWNGEKKIKGLNSFFDFLKRKSYKIQYRVMLSRYRGLSKCNECNGSRLNQSVKHIYLKNKNIEDIVKLSIIELLDFIKQIDYGFNENKVVERIKKEILSRLNSLVDLGLGYLTINRKSSTLSGGESQRIHIAKAIGSVLEGSIYVLDEPSVGLHSRDTQNLLKILKKLRDLGNTLIIVEHDKEIIQSADHIIDIGPFAGSRGGNIIYSGNRKSDNISSMTLDYIKNKRSIVRSSNIRTPNNFISINGINMNNLKNVDVKIPTKLITAVTGVSGSGKSTLIKDIFLPALKRKLKDFSYKKPNCESIESPLYDEIQDVSYVDQDSIKKSSKSTAITYINSFDNIRALFAALPYSKTQGFTSKHFSFNVDGGRCENCKGQGFVVIEMQFLSDIKIGCEVCNGKRYNNEILKVKLHDKNIYEILNLTVSEGYDFFNEHDHINIAKKLNPLIDVGLGYLKMGQTINTMSSGELQRLKLAHFLSEKNEKSILIFDEPTKGLHFYDVEILIKALDKLVQNGNTVIVVEHNIDVIKNVDWVIDMGPEGGDKGGKIIFNGTPEKLADVNSFTGTALKNEYSSQ